jgi:hypothetical protein
MRGQPQHDNKHDDGNNWRNFHVITSVSENVERLSDWAARFQSSVAGRIKLRNTLPPLAYNDELFDGVLLLDCRIFKNQHLNRLFRFGYFKS